MITQKDQEIIKEITTLKQLKTNTQKGLQQAVQIHTAANNASLNEMLEEAEADEENGVRPKKRRIKKRFINTQLYMQNKNYRNSSINNIIARIKSIYNFYELQTPKLQPLQRHTVESYEEIPTHDMIKTALNNTNIKMRALITFMASSGAGRTEAAKITIQDFINSTREYQDETELIKVITKLKKQNVVPTWNITRQKTNYAYVTFNTPECTNYICDMLQERLLIKEVEPADRLFEINEITITSNFKNINDKCNFGWKTTRRVFHAHALRKFFSSTLYGAGFDVTTINFMLGHRIGEINEAYIKASPQKQKDKYMEMLKYLTFYGDVVDTGLSDNERAELEELKQYKKESLERIKRLEELLKVFDV